MAGFDAGLRPLDHLRQRDWDFRPVCWRGDEDQRQDRPDFRRRALSWPAQRDLSADCARDNAHVGARAYLQHQALSAADQANMANIVGTATSATVLTIVGTGSGRLTLSESAASWSWATNFIHAYFGKRGAIDLVVQDTKSVDMRPTADRRGTNVFTSYLAGIKTFADGAKKFLDVKILVA